MKLWKYIVAHHEEYGTALFVVPVVVIAFLIIGLIDLIAELVKSWG